MRAQETRRPSATPPFLGGAAPKAGASGGLASTAQKKSDRFERPAGHVHGPSCGCGAGHAALAALAFGETKAPAGTAKAWQVRGAKIPTLESWAEPPIPKLPGKGLPLKLFDTARNVAD